MKVKVSTRLSYEGNTICYSGDGIFNDNVLKFREKDAMVILDFLNKKMVRDDSEKKLEYSFLENVKTLNSVLLKCNSYLVDISIYTIKFLVDGSCCHVCYKLLDEDSVVDYEVRWEEVK